MRLQLQIDKSLTFKFHLVIKHTYNSNKKEKILPGIVHAAAGKIPNDEYTWNLGFLKATAANDSLILLYVV